MAATGAPLTINLTNKLNVPTSLVILGQVGGGVGTPVKMDGPVHSGQTATTFPGNGQTTGPAFTPPAQGQRVRSFGAEVGAGATTALTWNKLKPGTYLYETGTMPSLEVPMGLYGILIVTDSPTATAPGTAYPGVSYDADTAMLFSEVDVVQNRAVDAAAAAGADVNKRFNDPSCSDAAPCYPAAVNYAPTYFLINGRYFDRTAPENGELDVPGTFQSSGNVLVRLLNAGSRTHVPTLVGTTLALVAEDGNKAPGNPKLQSHVLLTAGKTYDAIIRPPTAGSAYGPATYPVFDRALSLSSAMKPDGGMQAFVLVNHQAAVDNHAAPGDPGMLPAAAVAHAVDDTFKVPYNTTISGNVTANDFLVGAVQMTMPANGTLTPSSDGTFSYTPSSGFSGNDSFTYTANGGTTGATVTLVVADKKSGDANTPVAADDSYASNVATTITIARPGLLANDSDPNRFPLTASLASGGATTCLSATVNSDGSFTATANGGTCTFQYVATNSQGTASNLATVTINFGTASNLNVAVADASAATAIADYRWTLQEDLTFKHDTTGTPSPSTRTIATSFHRSHMNVVATGCTGPVSCGRGQMAYDPVSKSHIDVGANWADRILTPDKVVLDPNKKYYISILPADGSPPAHAMGGAEIRPAGASGWAPVNIKLQSTPLTTAQLSVYIYEDSLPTNGQNELEEHPLGGFNVILFDPAGRTGDPAGQQTYDAFNMPLSNALLGQPGCPDDQNQRTNGTGTSATGNMVGVVYTCPNDPNEGTRRANPAKYALAGHALIKNLTPARYDVIAHPGAARDGAGEVWWQTETLEGTPAQDAFTGINEPVYFQEFGPPGPHTTVGFVNPAHVAAYAQANHLGGSATITGHVTNQHMSRPSAVTLYDSGSYDALSSTTCRVVLNSQSGNGAAIAATSCDQDGNFTLTGAPAGDLSITVFDQWLDQIIQTVSVTVPTSSSKVDMGTIPVLSWFTQYDQNIFMDTNKDGIYDQGKEQGISNVPLTVRYRNGAPSNVTLSDSSGNGILVELFPLFNWYVAEADTTRFKQTGVNIVVDGGGVPDTTGDTQGIWTSKYATGESSIRPEVPGALSYGLQGFISQRNRIDWGRTPYVPNENGGIVGTVVYSSTRPFDDMRYNVQTIWEPLVPRVTVNLYKKETLADGTDTLTLVDTTKTSSWDDFVNTVYGHDGKPYLLDPDGNLRDINTGVVYPKASNGEKYPPGKQVNLQCPGQKPDDLFNKVTLAIDGSTSDTQRCYDGWHNWNQVQAAPYDGRYVFPSDAYVKAHPLTSAKKSAGQTLVSLPPGNYVVEVVTPPGYEIVKEEDKNILIGDTFDAPVTQQFGPLGSIFILPDQATLGNANPFNPSTGDPGFQSNPTTDLGDYSNSNATTFPPCVGNLHRVPDFLSLYPEAAQVAPFAGMERPLCDRKLITLNDQMQSSANFFVFTPVPIASNNTGIVLDDAASEFNATAPDFGEKASVPFVPISIRDFTGLEISRAYSDQWGAYNMMTVSSWLVNPPTPSGYGPNMLVSCINDPGPIPDPSGAMDPATGTVRMITDPAYNPAYSNFCYTNPFMPGQTTYLDTPVLPIAAYASGYNPADCALPDATPQIRRVDGPKTGPWLPKAGGTLTIVADGDQQILNPAYAGPFSSSGNFDSIRNVTRHYGFGGVKGTIKIGDLDLSNDPSLSWTDQAITVNVPAGANTGRLYLKTASGAEAVDTVTVTIENKQPTVVASGGSIQAAIDAAYPGDLIIVDAGLYNELVVMWQPVRLQGVGASSVIINAAKYPTSKLAGWRPRINALFNVDPVSGNQSQPSQVDPLPTQEITGGTVILEPSVLGSEEGAGITVLAKNLPQSACRNLDTGDQTSFGYVRHSNFRCKPSRIDGIAVTGGDAGGGIYVNGWAHGLEISNNRVYGNAGAYNGGVRVGVPYLETEALPGRGRGGKIVGLGYDVGVKIHHNNISKNGTVEAPAGLGGAGGGISICAGTDAYSIDHNYVCGNFTSSDGGGIGHLGFSQDGVIANNQILFNQSFQQTGATHGGGIVLEGEPPVAGNVTLGTGNVTIDSNVIRGNFAESGQGGGIRLAQVNGADVVGPATQWHYIAITNNMIDNNVAGWAGGGVSMFDALNTAIINNTIASNDSVGTAGNLLVANGGHGVPKAAGIVSEPTSAALLGRFTTPANKQKYANSIPTLTNDIIYRNRSFFYATDSKGNGQVCIGNSSPSGCATLPPQSVTGECVGAPMYWDLGLIGDGGPGTTAFNGATKASILTTSGQDPGLVGLYCNGARSMPEIGPVENPPGSNNITALNFIAASAADEANNYVSFRFGPLYIENPMSKGIVGNYHIGAGAALDKGISANAPNHDIDGDNRPLGKGFDIGADEVK